MDGRMSAELRQALIDAVAAVPSSRPTVRARTALHLLAASPRFSLVR
jgi:hypothetical protein